MIRVAARRLTLVACATWLIAHGNPAMAAAERAETQTALQDIVEQLNDLDAWFSDAEAQRARWLKDVQEKDKQVDDLSRSAQAANQALAEVERQREQLTAQHAELEVARNRQAQKIAQHLAAAHRLSGQDFVKLLLNQQAPDDVDRMLRYHGYFSAARAGTLQAYEQTLTDLAASRAALEAKAQQARERHAQLLERQAALSASREQRQTLLAELDAEREDKAVLRERLRADQQRLEALLAELNRRATQLDGSAFLASKGKLPWPVQGPIRATFGRPRADGRLVWHGMVVSAEEGTPIKAVYRGRVVFADWLRGFGLLTIVDHGSGFMTLYGHADSLTKVVGDWVEAGELIARAGRSGGQSKSGLYFEIRQKGTARDPLGWLTKRKT